MKTKTIVFFIIIIFSLSCLLKLSKCQIIQFPEKVNEIDEIFTEDDPNLFLYETGYPENPLVKKFIYAETQAIKFVGKSYYKLLATDTLSYQTNDLAQLKIAKDAGTLLEDLYKFSVSTNNPDGIVLGFEFSNGANTSYSYNLNYRMFNHGGNGDLILMGYDGTDYTIDLLGGLSVDIPSNSMNTIIFKVTQLAGSSGTQVKATYTINNVNYDNNITFRTLPTRVDFKVSITGAIANQLTFGPYWVILDNSGTNLFTTTGAVNCSASGKGCLEGYSCFGTNCNRCHDSCKQCTVPRGVASDSLSCTSCEKHTKFWKNSPNKGKCPIEYVDLNQYNDISIEFEPSRTDRLTLGFWVYINDMNAMNTSDTIINISVSDFLVVSISAKSDTTADSACNVYEKTKPNVKTQTTSTGLTSMLSANPADGLRHSIINTQSRWFYTRCAVSYYENSFYLKSKSNSSDYILTEDLLYEAIWLNTLTRTNVHFRTIYRIGDLANLQINNARHADSKVYIKNLYIMREYLDPDMNFQYWNVHTQSDQSNVPFMLLAIGFDEFNSSKQEVTYYEFKAYASRVDLILKLTPLSVQAGGSLIDMFAPDNFRRLETHTSFNIHYTVSDLHTINALTVGANQLYVYDHSLAYTCDSDNYIDLVPSGANRHSCNADCPVNGTDVYTIFPGLAYDRGYCAYKCQPSANCPYQNALLNTLSSSFSCNNGFNAYYSCVSDPPSRRYALYFSSFYTSHNIVFNQFSKIMDSYIVEIWWMRDNMLHVNNITKAPAPYFRNYVFYTNTLKLYYDGSNNEYFATTPNNIFSVSVNTWINNAEWNKLVFYCKYIAPTYNFEFYVKNTYRNMYSNPNTPNIGSTISPNNHLKHILFCHLDISNCKDGGDQFDLHWFSGYYKDLRIWDGDLANPWVLSQYEQYWGKNTYRSLAIYAHYDFKLKNMIGNKFVDWFTPSNTFDYSSGTNKPAWNEDNIALFNYNSEFDYIETNNLRGSYVDTVVNQAATTGTCFTNCDRCFAAGNGSCYECKTGSFLTQATCISNSNGRYWFSVPPNPAEPLQDIEFNIFPGSIYPAATITFWIKVFGFFTSRANIIEYGYNLKLIYDGSSNTAIDYGLNLYFSLTGTNSRITNIPDFRMMMGQWAFFSLAYFYDPTVKSFYPPMMKFEMNQNSYPLDSSVSKEGLDIMNFVIKPDFIGLIGRIKAYDKYIIGAYAIETNKFYVVPVPVKTYLNPGTNSSNCITMSNAPFFSRTPVCKVDYDFYFDISELCKVDAVYFNVSRNINSTSCNNCPNKPAAWGGGQACSTGCVGDRVNSAGDFVETCYCVFDNINIDSMILKNNDDNICYRYDYINFARSDVIVLTNVTTAKDTERYTMQFWIWAQNYVDTNWDGITFEWNYHNKIRIVKNASNSYEYKCNPFYQLGNTTYENSLTGTLSFNMNTWMYISCAVDAKSANEYYMNTESSNFSAPFSVAKPPLTTISTTTLRITENSTTKEWGVLFLRQIRLWNDAYRSSGFLSRVKIDTPSLFGSLLSLWDPIYSGVNQLVDVCGKSPTLSIPYKPMPDMLGTNRIGQNVIDDTSYSLLFLCSEHAQFYDATTGTCVNFVNLVMLNEFKFPDVPVSYKGNYSIEFWLFTEDYADVTNGVNIIYDNHVSVAVLKTASNTLGANCFPQAYYNDIKGKVGTQIDIEFSNALNKVRTDLTNKTGVWSWVRCAVSNYNKHFYINDTVMQSLTTETLYDSTKNIYPFRYYNFSNSKVDVLVQGIGSHTKKIYIRYLYVFNDFLPQTYKFNYMDLTVMKQDAMENLLLACNFANYNLTTNSLNYKIYQYGMPTTTSFISTVPVGGATYALAANFVPLPLCDPTLRKRYNEPTNTCVDITSCVLPTLNADYCYDENKPLQCLVNNYYASPDANTHVCSTSCPTGRTRSPGQVNNKALCNYDCINTANCPVGSFAQLSDFPNNYTCQPGYTRVNYQCVVDIEIENSSVFFSGCYNSPNFFHSFTTTTTLKITKGHILEFWFKLDTVQNYCNLNKTTGSEYYFYSKPHAIFRDFSNSQFYYAPTTFPPNKGVLPSIQLYEWNRILIKVTDLTLPGQSVTVYVNYNFDSPEFELLNIPASSNMDMQSISFCSDSTKGFCDSLTDIIWGSAYYRNIRIWDVGSSTVQLTQAFSNKMFTESLKSMINYYPLVLSETDLNKFSNIAANQSYDHMEYSSVYSVGPDIQYNPDQDALYNWSTNFDWGVYNLGKYITSMSGSTISYGPCSSSCKRCYAASTPNSCYECELNFIGIGQKCINVTGYYFKTPVTTPNSPVSLKIADPPLYDITQETAITMTFWMKFFGINYPSVSSVPPILNINSNTFFGYDLTTNYLVFNQNNKNVFTDKNFNNYIGIWIPMTFSNYKANTISHYYPNMVTISVNRLDIPMTTGYTIPTSGISITEVKLGYEAVALFAEFKFYSNFYQGGYGHIMSTLINRPINMITEILLTGTSVANCISDADLAGSSTVALGTTCVGDYHIYLDTTIQCDDNNMYFDPALIAVLPPCGPCDNICNTLCFNSSNKECTCDMTVGQFWLRRKEVTLDAYCDKITNIDFSSYDPIEISNLKGSLTGELTLEVWAYVYVYNPNNVVFSSIDIIWDMHNRINLYNKSNSLNVSCYSMVDKNDLTKYSENISIVLNYYKWNLIRCGTDRNNLNYYLNSSLKPVETVDLPDLPEKTSLMIGQLEPNSIINFGFIFLREIKLWQQFNFKYVNTGNINIDYKLYPGLLHLFPNDINNSTLYEETNFNQLALTRRVDFIGYNFVDPQNKGLYSNLKLCSEGEVYDETKLICITPVTTKCNHPGDTNDKCITCQKSKIFIDPDTGNCVPECPPRNFGHLKMNQCRPCHETCYKCFGITNHSCSACTGILYLNPNIHACVPNCEFYALTVSLTIPNMCTLFDATAELVNVDEINPINPSTFTYIEAAVTKATAEGYTVQWKLNFTETLALNDNLVTLDPEGPFSEDPPSSKLAAGLKPSFFEPGKKYNFVLDIIKRNEEYQVSVSKNWTVIMSSPPFGGALEVTPTTGYRITTVFLMTCDGWSTNIPFPMTYRFYAKEVNTNIEIKLTDWMSKTYTSTNFDVRYYQLESSIMTVTCEVKDGFDMVAKSSVNVTIVNTPKSTLYNLNEAMSNYKPKEKYNLDELLMRSEYLKSLGVDIYKDIKPTTTRANIINSLDFTRYDVEEPVCIQNFCNFRGFCDDRVDIYMACKCDIGYVGDRCQVDKSGYPELVKNYQQLFTTILTTVSEEISIEHLHAVRNLFIGAAQFHQDPSFFSTNIDTWVELAKSNFKSSIMDNILAYIDIYDAAFKHNKDRLISEKLSTKNATNYPLRNITMLPNEQVQFQKSSFDLRNQLESLVNFIIEQYGVNSNKFKYESDNFYLAASLISPTFNTTEFFLDRIDKFRSYTSFMDCINYIQIERLNNPYYSIWFVFIEYKDYPLSYDMDYYKDSISPYITLYFIDAVTNKPIIVEGCEKTPITLFLPFNSVRWVEDINKQKNLYKPENFYGPNNPIFSSPVFINETGFVSDDTVEERIKKYHRNYNFTCNYYNKKINTFNDSGLTFEDINKNNYLICNSTHSTDFNMFILLNDVVYKIDGPFFYLKFPQVFTYWPNYTSNYAFFVIVGLLSYYIITVIFTTCYDWKYYRQEVLLEFLKYNIIKVQMPYNQKIEFNPNQIFPIDDFMFDDRPKNEGINAKDRFGDDKFNEVNLRPKIGGQDLGKNVIQRRKKDDNPYMDDYEADKRRNDNFNLPLFNDDIFNLGEDMNTNMSPFDDKKPTVTNNPYISSEDKITNAAVLFNLDNNVNVNHIIDNENKYDDKDKELNDEAAYDARIAAFAALNLSTCQFLCWNLKARHILLAPILNSSLFNPRYKKLTIFISGEAIHMILLSVLLTNNQTVYISFSKPDLTNAVGTMISYCVLCIFASNLIAYSLLWMFRMTSEQRKNLYLTVKKGIQLRILRVWNETEKKNMPYTIIGMLINYMIWIGCFYFTFNYVSVWREWDITWLISFAICFVMDVIVLEFLAEFNISIWYYFRQNSRTACKFAEWLNRVRNYRSMWP